MSDNRLNVEGLTVNNIVADKIQTRSIEILSDGTGSDGEGVSKNIFGSDVKVATRPYENNLTKIDNNGAITKSNSVAIISRDGKEDNVIIHRNPAGITSSPYISIESHNNGASLTLKDNSELANDVYGAKGGFELKATKSSIKGESNGSLSLNDKIKITSEGHCEVKATSKTHLNIGYNYNTSDGALLSLKGTSHADYPGVFQLFAKNENTSKILTGYPDGTLTWAGEHVMRLVESTSGAKWAKKYSDGLIIQSGTVSSVGQDANSSAITFSKAFSNTNYYVNIILENVDINGGGGMWTVKSKTTSSFVFHNGQDSTGTFRWIAIGY